MDDGLVLDGEVLGPVGSRIDTICTPGHVPRGRGYFGNHVIPLT